MTKHGHFYGAGISGPLAKSIALQNSLRGYQHRGCTLTFTLIVLVSAKYRISRVC